MRRSPHRPVHRGERTPASIVMVSCTSSASFVRSLRGVGSSFSSHGSAVSLVGIAHVCFHGFASFASVSDLRILPTFPLLLSHLGSHECGEFSFCKGFVFVECFERGHRTRHLVPELIDHRCDSLQRHGLQFCGRFVQQCDQACGGRSCDFHRGVDPTRSCSCSSVVFVCGGPRPNHAPRDLPFQPNAIGGGFPFERERKGGRKETDPVLPGPGGPTGKRPG